MNREDDEHIVFFDGVCNLCHGAVRFIIHFDHKKIFKFSSLQSDFAKKILGNDLPKETLVYFNNGQIYLKSTGALKIARQLKYITYFYYMIYIPKSIRDFGYDLIARYRYHIFGKKDHCPAPDPKLADRFID